MIWIKNVNLDETVWTLVQREPSAKIILDELGFHQITNEAMLNTAGKFMTLRKASTLRKIKLELIIDKFNKEGYEVLYIQNELTLGGKNE